MTERARVLRLWSCSSRLGMALWRCVLGMCWVASSSCKLDSHVNPHTQMVVDIDADRAVRARVAHVVLLVSGSDERDALAQAAPRVQRTISLDVPGPYWPLREVVEPQAGNADRYFLLSATARGADDDFVASVTVISGYVSGEVRHITLRLTAACLGVRCDVEQSCEAGSCGDAWREPGDQPYFDETADTRAGTSAEGDAGSKPPVYTPDDDAGAGPLTSDGLKIDVCSVNHGGCDILVSCQIAKGQRVCGVCPAGYDDERGDGTRCVDRNECLENNGGCDLAHGRCSNTPGRFECRCADGFHGDGKYCSANVPCEDSTGCAENASCSRAGGQRVCVCNDGFEGNGATCKDLDECARNLDDCDGEPSACVNEAGSYRCECPAGFTGDGRGDGGCVDSDECKLGTDDCDDSPDACVNTEGSFTCKCPADFTGAGRGVDGCADRDECALNSDDCSAVPDACVNDAPGFHCACPPGYSGDGRGASGCVDVNECALEGGACSSQRECVNTPGGFSCGACPAGFAPSGPNVCVACACFQRDGEKACDSTRASLPATASEPFKDARTFNRYIVFAQPVTLPANARVASFGALRPSSDTRVDIAMGLYSDDGGSPGQRVVRAEPTQFIGKSVTLDAIADGADCLRAGTYWLAGLADGNVTLGLDTDSELVPIARGSAAGLFRVDPVLPLNWPIGPDTRLGTARVLNMYVTFDHP